MRLTCDASIPPTAAAPKLRAAAVAVVGENISLSPLLRLRVVRLRRRAPSVIFAPIVRRLLVVVFFLVFLRAIVFVYLCKDSKLLFIFIL